MGKQSTSTLVMVRPSSFFFDPETAESNSFQKEPAVSAAETAESALDSADSALDSTTDSAELLRKALAEFDAVVEALRSKDIEVIVIEDNVPGDKPNAIFPNNWFSTHSDGTVVLYAMSTPSRRLERDIPVVETLEQQGFEVPEIVDLSFYEEEGQFLEGTGSLILDRVNRLAFAGLSNRTDAELVRTFGYELDFETFTFKTADQKGKPVYHTNVMMAIGTGFAVVCLDAVKDDYARSELKDRLTQWGLEVIEITFAQMEAFAGNVLEVASKNGQRYLLISSSALESLTPEQKQTLQGFVEFLPVDIPTIQQVGGGGIRCMVAEVFLNNSIPVS